MSGGPAWVNGALGGGIDPHDRGLTLGDGVFDTLVAFRGVPFAGDRHMERLQGQATSIGIEVDAARLRDGWNEVLQSASAEHVILRTTVTRGASGRGLWPQPAADPTLIVTGAPWNPALFGAPVRLATSSITRDPGSPSCRLKTLGYLDQILATREAAANGADEALMLTAAGRVSCTTIANVFALVGDRLLTPPLTDAVQPGIMRRLVLDAAPQIGLAAEESSLTAEQLAAADGVFLTNSVRFVCPCRSLDGRPLSDSRADKLADLSAVICGQVQDQCGFDPRLATGPAMRIGQASGERPTFEVPGA